MMGLNKSEPGGRTEIFSLSVDVKSSLRRRLRGLSLVGGRFDLSDPSLFSQSKFLSAACFVAAASEIGKLSRRDVVVNGAREASDTANSSVKMSSVSESDASVSDVTRGDPRNGASRLEN